MLPLISVMMADGTPKPAEQEYVGQLLEAFNSPPVPQGMMRVHEPHDTPMPRTKRDRLRMIESMVKLVHLDQNRTGIEMQIVRKYATAWDISEKWVKHYDDEYGKQYSSGLKRLWRSFSSKLK